MKFYQIYYFITVCQKGSISKAAEILHVSQPCLSKAILSIEEEIGFPLFERTKAGMILSKEGEQLLAQAIKVVDEMEKFDRLAARLHDNNKQDSIHIGIPPLYGSMLINRVEEHFQLKDVQNSIIWVEEGTTVLMEMLDSKKIDMAIIPSKFVNLAKYEWVDVCKSEEVICVSKSHRLNGRSISDSKDLENENFILFEESFEQNLIFSLINLNPKKFLVTSQLYTAVQMASLDKGIILIHKKLIDEYNLSNKISTVSFEPPLIIDLVAIWKPKTNSTKELIIANDLKAAAETI